VGEPSSGSPATAVFAVVGVIELAISKLWVALAKANTRAFHSAESRRVGAVVAAEPHKQKR
jgi:hypothetical protein